MSRIGKRILNIPKNVEIKISPDFKNVIVKGPLGILNKKLSGKIEIYIEDDKLRTILPKNTVKTDYALWGTTNSLIDNFLQGVVKEFKKELIVTGLGYKVFLKGDVLEMNLGFSHSIIFNIPEFIKIEVKNNRFLKITGIDKELVGLVASKIRKFKKVEPYKGKGIAYVGEKVIRKVGKTAVGKG